MKKLKQYISTQWGTAMVFAFVCGWIAHFFALVNVLHNCDDIAQQPVGYGTGITSGRWLLTMLGDFLEYWGWNYNLPFVNGLLFLLLLAVSAGFLVSALRIRKRAWAALAGMLLVVFPSVTVTMIFRYTVVYYGIAVLLAVAAAWVLPKGKYGFLLSALCITLSLGLYQAFIPLTISIFVLVLIRLALEGNADVRRLLRRGLRDCAALLLGLGLYYLCLKISLAVYGTALSDYQGVGDMGKLSLADLPGLIKEAVYCVCMLPVKNYCGLAGSRTLKLLYLLLAGVSVIMAVYLLVARVKKPSVAVMTVLLGAVLPVAVNFIVIMCPDAWIYTLMVYPFVLLPCVPIVLADCLPPMEGTGKRIRGILVKGIGLMMALMIFCYAYEANVHYSALYFANRQVENYLTSLVVQIRMTEGFDAEKEWAFIGRLEDPMLRSYWQYEINYSGLEFTDMLLNRDSRYEWTQNYVGISPTLSDEEKTAQLSKLEEVQAMPCWPNQGSIKIIGDTVVVKFQDLS